MNFTGQSRRSRNINLGGRNSSGGVSRQSVLQKAQQERERRERARKEERAAIIIQSFYRGKNDLYTRRISEQAEWDKEFLSVLDENSMEVTFDPNLLESCIIRYNFFEKPLFNLTDESCTNRLRCLDKLINQHQEISDQVPSTVLDKFINLNMMHILDLYDKEAGSLKNGNNLYYTLNIMSNFPNQVKQEVLIKLTRLIKKLSVPQESHFIEQKLWGCTLEFSKFFPQMFWIHVLTIPYFYSKWQQFATPEDSNLVHNIVNSIVLDSDIEDQHQSENLANTLGTKEISWILSNLLRLTEKSPLTIKFLGVLTTVLSVLYTSLHSKGGVHNVNENNDDSEDEEEDDSDDYKMQDDSNDYLTRPLNEFIKDQFVLDCIDKLYTRSFTNNAFSLLSKETSSKSPESAAISRHIFALFYVTLIKIHPARRRDVLLYLSFVSDMSAANIFWQSFKQSSLTYALVTDGALSREDLEAMGERDHQSWVQLVLTLELYSYWLVVADDSEIFEEKARGLPFEEVEKLANFLKNMTFSFLWYWSDLKDVMRSSIAPFKRLKNVSLLVMRQIYIRDSRRPFLGDGFWLMTKHFNMSMFMSGVVEEQDRLLRLEHDDDSGEEEPSNIRRAYQRPAVRQKQNVEPRLNILRQAPFFLPFDVRVNIFQAFIETDKKRTGVTQEDWMNQFSNNNEVVEIFRGRELEDAFEKFHRRDNMKHRLRISFQTEYGPEPGIDGGGLTKEFLTSVCNEGFDTQKGLFSTTQNHLFYPNPALGVSPEKSGINEDEREQKLQQIEFMGKLIGKCLYDNVLVDVDFAPFFLQKSAGVSYKNTFDDLYTLDPEIYNNLVKVRKYPGDVENDLGLNFSIDQDVGDGKKVTIELRKDGENLPVTNANRLEYIHSIANFKLNSILAPQTNAFFRGMSQLISSNWLKMFNANELQMLISGGTATIDIEDLKFHTEYGGYSAGSETIQLFWEIFTELEDDDKCALIKFVTSVPKAPLGGFRKLEPRFAIRNSGQDMDRLPTASTCVNLLKLPNYRDKRILKEKLLYSIRSNAGFELS